MFLKVQDGAPWAGGREGEGAAGHLLAAREGGRYWEGQRARLRVRHGGGARIHEGHLRDAGEIRSVLFVEKNYILCTLLYCKQKMLCFFKKNNVDLLYKLSSKNSYCFTMLINSVHAQIYKKCRVIFRIKNWIFPGTPVSKKL